MKSKWDIFITVVLVYTCFATPWEICFENDSTVMVIVNIVIDVFFLIDLILTFLTAYHTDDFETEDDHKVIAYNYLTGWFLIDLLAIIPF